jgi:hypothetical protein
MSKHVVTALGLGILAGALAIPTALAVTPKTHSLSPAAAKAYCIDVIPKPAQGYKAAKTYQINLASCIKFYSKP